MKILDDNEIIETWKDFANNHGINVIQKEQTPILSAANRNKQFLTSEKHRDFIVFYKYIYYKLNPIKLGDYLRIFIPVETDEKFIICRPGLFSRIFFGQTIKIQPENSIELDNYLKNLINESYSRFSDLKIQISSYCFVDFELSNKRYKVLELSTNKLPIKLNELNNLRDLSLKTINYFSEQKKIRPLTDIE